MEKTIEQHSGDLCTERGELILRREPSVWLQPSPREAVGEALRRCQGSHRREFTKDGQGKAESRVPHWRSERYGISGEGRGGTTQGVQIRLG